ncbi:unnamed protein product, partial [Amoebophrya sp. A120]|eukprot:GSA120T00025026001.1
MSLPSATVQSRRSAASTTAAASSSSRRLILPPKMLDHTTPGRNGASRATNSPSLGTRYLARRVIDVGGRGRSGASVQ